MRNNSSNPCGGTSSCSFLWNSVSDSGSFLSTGVRLNTIFTRRQLEKSWDALWSPDSSSNRYSMRNCSRSGISSGIISSSSSSNSRQRVDLKPRSPVAVVVEQRSRSPVAVEGSQRVDLKPRSPVAVEGLQWGDLKPQSPVAVEGSQHHPA
mmetsp:Transcript_69698/g.134442  ORF Transcript_69698/g.134442 Transcript_69698/m.134442 type:complete len:151 (+) Transcript_69698:202-654(+)